MAQRRTRQALTDPSNAIITAGTTELVPADMPDPNSLVAYPQAPRSKRPRPIVAEPKSSLWFGDNLDVLRRHIPSESVDLVYLDPPFNSNRSYNLLFRGVDGLAAPAQIRAFDDTWTWSETSRDAFADIVKTAPAQVSHLIGALVEALGKNDLTAYLVMMTQRLIELHRVMKPSATLWLHCDPTASHYLKIALDALFGPKRFLNEITWKRSSAHSDTKQGMKRCGRIRDVLLVYSKSDDYTWNTVYTPYSADYVERHYRHIDQTGRRYRTDNLTAAKGGGDTSYEWHVKRALPGGVWEADLDNEYLRPHPGWEYKGVPPYRGRYWAYSRAKMEQFARDDRLVYSKNGTPNYRRYLDEMPGVPLQDLWDDISPALGAEQVGFPTQKPLALLERIISVGSNPGDRILDPFCGCGTAVVAAEKLNRRWIGIDVTSLAVGVIQKRLERAFPDAHFQVHGWPTSVADAHALFERDPYQLQWWAASQIGALPQDGRPKKGKDRGIDGIIPFADDLSGVPKRAIVSVKGGKNPGPTAVRDLLGAVESNQAAVGVLVLLNDPTRDVRRAAAEAGIYQSGLGHIYPRIQVLTIEDILERGALPRLPSEESWRPRHQPYHRQTEQVAQASLWIDQAPETNATDLH